MSSLDPERYKRSSRQSTINYRKTHVYTQCERLIDALTALEGSPGVDEGLRQSTLLMARDVRGALHGMQDSGIFPQSFAALSDLTPTLRDQYLAQQELRVYSMLQEQITALPELGLVGFAAKETLANHCANLRQAYYLGQEGVSPNKG